MSSSEGNGFDTSDSEVEKKPKRGNRQSKKFGSDSESENEKPLRKTQPRKEKKPMQFVKSNARELIN